MHYCDHALSVVRPSVRPSLTFHIFDFSSETAERNSTKFVRNQDLNVLYQVCAFRASRKNKMAALASDWLRHFRLLLWNRWTEFNETWQEARSLLPLPSVFFGLIRKTKWPPWPLIGWDIFDFSSVTAERNSTSLDRKQDLNVLHQVCVFRADRKNKMAALASDWLRHFLPFLWNRWTEFNETWQETRSQCLLPSSCFSGWWVNKNFCPSWSVKKAAHCTQVHDMWPFGPLVCLRSIAAHRDHFVRRLSVRPSVFLSVQWLFSLVDTQSYVSQATNAFLIPIYFLSNLCI